MVTKVVAVLAVVGLALAGCSSSSTPPTSSESPSTAAPSSAPTGSMTKEQAAAYYLQTACPANEAIDELIAMAREGNETTFDVSAAELKKIKPKAQEVADMLRLEAEAMGSPPQPWPADVASDIGDWVSQELETVAAYQGVAQAKNPSEFAHAWTATTKNNLAAAKVRSRLGLPAPGSKDDGCPKP